MLGLQTWWYKFTPAARHGFGAKWVTKPQITYSLEHWGSNRLSWYMPTQLHSWASQWWLPFLKYLKGGQQHPVFVGTRLLMMPIGPSQSYYQSNICNSEKGLHNSAALALFKWFILIALILHAQAFCTARKELFIPYLLQVLLSI